MSVGITVTGESVAFERIVYESFISVEMNVLLHMTCDECRYA